MSLLLDKMSLLAGNLLIDMAKKLCPKIEPTSTHDLQQWAAKASDERFQKANIPTKYRPFLRKLGDVSDYAANIFNDF
jgi:hypothetical protein